MRLVRSLAFIIAFYATTASMAIIGIPSLLLPRQVLYVWQHIWAHIVAWQLRVICNITHHIDGSPAPHQVIYAVKHQSAWEGIVLFAYLKSPVVVLKKSLLFLPIFGLYLLRSGVMAIDRSRGTNALTQIVSKSKTATAKGRSLLIFPQGTRVAPSEYRRYHRGVYAIYAECRLPVVPVALNSGHFWGKGEWQKYPGQIRVRILPAIAPGLTREDFMAKLEATLETESQALAPKPKRR